MNTPSRRSPLRIGIDLGGTKIEGVVAQLLPSGEAPQILARRRVPTQRERGYDHIVTAVAQLIREVAAEAGLANEALPPIGVGMPGSVNRAGVVKNSNTTVLNGRPFREDLMRQVGRPIAFSNDANCFALAEACFGAGRGHELVFGIILGTGVGGGIVLPHGHGRDLEAGSHPMTWDGPHGLAGEWGHVPLDPVAGPPCYCGRRGCVETYLCGPAIEADYARRSGQHLPLAELAARTDDPAATAALDAATAVFGRAVAMLINILDPDVIVLGGGVSKLDLWYQKGPAEVSRWIFGGLGAGELSTPIVRHQIGDSAGVLGAALLGRD